MERRQFLAAAGGVAVATASAAKTQPKQATGGLSQPRLGRMTHALAAHVESGRVPGLVALVSRRGEVRVEAIGTMAAEGAGGPVRRDTIFRIASMTKPVAAAAAMILVEEGSLRLDEPVDRLLPELADRRVLTRPDAALDSTVPANRPITVRDVLTFRLGHGIMFEPHPIMNAYTELELGNGPPAPQVPPEPDEWMRRLGTLPLIHQPGERWLYNTGSDVLGVLIARAAGQPLEAFLQERLFGPLGMVDTGFSVPAAKLDRLATSYWTMPETGALQFFDGPEDSQWATPPAFPSAAGGLVSTVDDYLAFAAMLLNQGRHGADRILSRPAVELMTADQLTPEQKAVSELVEGMFDSLGWGLGIGVVTRRDQLGPTVGAFGWDGGLGTSAWIDPREELVGILLTQAAFTSPSQPDVVRDFWTTTYQAIDD